MKRYIFILIFIVSYCLNPINCIAKNNEDTCTFDFYGNSILLSYDKSFYNTYDEKIGDKSFDIFCKKMQKTNYKNLIKQLNSFSKSFQLDDLGFYLLLSQFVESAYENYSDNYKTLFKWFILSKKGFSTYIAYNDKDLKIYGKFNIPLRGVKKIEVENESYFDLSFEQNKTSTKWYLYNNSSNKKAQRKLSIDFNKNPLFKNDTISKTYKFYYDKEYVINATINKSLIDYYNNMPQILLQKPYTYYKLSSYVELSLISDLKKIINNRNQNDAINIILSFVQSLKYQADTLQFGYERAFFPEETLYYDYSDCEDRALLFACLVKELLGVKSIFIEYALHANIALLIYPDKSNLKSITYKGQNYIICEPTMYGFKVGEIDKNRDFTNIIPLY